MTAASVEGVMIVAAIRAGVETRNRMSARSTSVSDGRANQRDGRSRRLKAWPRPGMIEDSTAAKRRRRSVGPVSGRTLRAWTRE